MLGIIEKQPADIIDQDIDYSRWFPADDVVTTAVGVVTPAYDPVDNPNGMQVNSTQVNGLDVKVWMSGGVSGKTYKITVTASTSGGRTKEVDFQVRVKDC